MAKSHGLIMDLLDSLSRPGQAVKNALAGRSDSAMRQLEQLPLDIIDSVLPKAWQPDDIATDEDSMSGRELVGAPDTFWGHALGFGVDVATDPLTWLPASWAAKGLGAIGHGAEAGINAIDKVLPGTADKVSNAGKWVRDVTGQQKWDQPEVAAALDRNRNKAQLWGQASMDAAGEALKGLDKRQRTIVADAIRNEKWAADGSKPVDQLVDTGNDVVTGVNSAGLRDRIAAHPDVLPQEIDDLTQRAEALAKIGRSQKEVPSAFDPDTKSNLSDEYMMRDYQGLKKDPLAELQGRGAPGKTAPMLERTNKDVDDIAKTLSENPDATYERDPLALMGKRASYTADMAKKAGAGEALFDWMRRTGNIPDDVMLDELKAARAGAVKPPVPESGAYADVNDMLGGEAIQPQVPSPQSGTSVVPDLPPVEESIRDIYGPGNQTGKSVVGESAKQPSLGLSDFSPEEHAQAMERVLSKDFYLSDPWARETAKKAAGLMYESGSPETAKMALDALTGTGQRGKFWQTLAKSNAYFKRFASYGLVIPRAGKLFRNRLDLVLQAWSNPATRGQALNMLKTMPADLASAVAEAAGYKGIGEAGDVTSEFEHAMKMSGGNPETALAQLGQKYPKQAAFIGNGGMDGMVRGDDLLAEFGDSAEWIKKIRSAADFPGRIARALEDRARMQLGTAQIEKYMSEGMSLDDAAKAAVKDTGDSFYRYSANSANNQKLKDLIPYASWSTQSIPAELKAMAGSPAYASVVSHAMQKDPKADPLYPYMDDQVNFDLGKDETGNRQVVNGFGFPFETLGEIPNPFAPIGQFGRQVEKNVVGQASPVLKTAYSVVTGRDPNFETPFGTYDKIPVAGNAGTIGRLYNMAQSTGALTPVDAPLKMLDQAMDERRSLPTRALGLLTGANIVTVDPLRAKAQQLQEELERNPDVSSIAHLTSKDPDAKALIDELADVQKKMKARRRMAQ